MPPTLQASLLYDAFVQLPLLVVLTVGIWKLKSWPWLRTWRWCTPSAVMNMYFYFMQTFLGGQSPAPRGLPADEPAVGHRCRCWWPTGSGRIGPSTDR